MTKLIVLLSLSAAFVATNKLDAPASLELVGNQYLVSQTTATFFDALITCRIYNSRLVSVLSDQDSLSLNRSIPMNATYWLGGVYLNYGSAFGSKWIWIESETDVGYTNWKPGEPALQGSSTNCIALNNLNQWIAYSCTQQFKFICKT